MFDRLDYLKTLNCNAQYDWNAHTTYDGLVNLGLGEVTAWLWWNAAWKSFKNVQKSKWFCKKKRQALIEDIEAYQTISGFDFSLSFSKKAQG